MGPVDLACIAVVVEAERQLVESFEGPAVAFVAAILVAAVALAAADNHQLVAVEPFVSSGVLVEPAFVAADLAAVASAAAAFVVVRVVVAAAEAVESAAGASYGVVVGVDDVLVAVEDVGDDGSGNEEVDDALGLPVAAATKARNVPATKDVAVVVAVAEATKQHC